MTLPGAHIAGIPVEETLTMMAPALSVGLGVLLLTLRERLRALIPSRFRRAGGASEGKGRKA